MKKRSCLFFIFLLVLPVPLFSESLEEILAKSKELSSYYDNMLGKSASYDFNSKLLELEKEHSIKVSMDEFSVNGSEGFSRGFVNISPSFSFESKEDNKTSFSLSSPMTLYYNSNNGAENIYKPSFSFNQKILIDGVEDVSLDLAKKSAIITYYSYKNKLDLQFESLVYSAISSILTAQGALDLAKAEHNKSGEEFKNLLENNFIKEGEFDYNTYLNTQKNEESQIKQKELTLVNAKKEFFRIASFDFPLDLLETLDPISFDIQEGGNSSVELARIDMLAGGEPSPNFRKNFDRTLDVGTGLDLQISDKKARELSATASLKYSDKKLNSSVFFEPTYDFDAKNFSPKVGVSATYSFGTNTDETNRIKRQAALIEWQDKTYTYNNKLYEYSTQAGEMIAKVAVKNLELERQKLILENAKREFESKKALYEEGYYSALDFAVFEATYNKAKLDFDSFPTGVFVFGLRGEDIEYLANQRVADSW